MDTFNLMPETKEKHKVIIRDSASNIDYTLYRFTKIQKVYAELNPDHFYIKQSTIENELEIEEIDRMSSDLLIKIAEYYK